MPIPFHGPTSAQFAPDMGSAVADNQVLPIAAFGFVYRTPHISYVVQPGDTLGDVARTLYGNNSPDSRNRVRNAGFYPGSIIHVPTGMDISE